MPDAAAIGENGSGLVIRDTSSVQKDIWLKQFFNDPSKAIIYGTRASDSSPSGHLMLFQNLAQNLTLWDLNINGSLTIGQIPEARIVWTDPGADTI